MFRHKPDLQFLLLLGGILAFGFLMLSSASGPLALQKFGDAYWYTKHQLWFGLVPGSLLFFFFANVDYRTWLRYAPKLLVVSIALLSMVFIPGLAADWGTSRSWVFIGGFSFQPVEAVKLLFLCYLAALLASRGEHGMADVRMGTAPFVVSVGIIAALLMAQPDLGSLMVIGSIAFVTYFAAGAPWSHVTGMLVAGLVGVFALIKSAPYRFNRFMTFLHPELDPQGVGYHINQAYMAIGSGGWFGQGLGHSRQKYLYLPEVAGDSVFAVISEELGFVVTLAALALLFALISRMLHVAKHAPDAFGRLLATGIAAWVCCQSLFNIGSMLGLVPITGLPLPFISYGGTAMTVLLGAMGVMANISAHGTAGEGVRRGR